jgi:hypothetical protein
VQQPVQNASTARKIANVMPRGINTGVMQKLIT